MQSSKPSKRELTRARVVQAAIDCIYEHGFNAAHTNRIAEAAGVSWGVLQYHFGDKDGLYEAVLETIFEDFSNTLSSAELSENSLEDKVAEMIELVWSLVSMREYRVSLAILRNAGKDDTSAINGQRYISNWAKRVAALWDTVFADEHLAPYARETGRQLMFAALRGMADDINPDGRTSQKQKAQREALAKATVHIMRSGD